MDGPSVFGWLTSQFGADPLAGALAPQGVGGSQGSPAARQRLERFEHTPWFQGILDMLWPAIRGAVEHELLEGSVALKLASAVPGLRFSTASLGNEPPQLHGARTVPGEQTGSMCTIFDLGFHAGSTINICIALGPVRASIRELTFRGRLCLYCVGIKPRKPVISGLRFFFTNQPTLSFQFGGLAAALPMNAEKLRMLVLKVISDKFVLPHVRSLHLDVISGAFAEAGFLPYHKLHSPAPHGLLRLCVMGLDGFPFAATHYVNLRVGSYQQATDTPAATGKQGYSGWQRDFGFVVDLLLDQDLQLELYDKDKEGLLLTTDRMLAHGSVSINELINQFRASAKSGSMPLARVEVRGTSSNQGPRAGGVVTVAGSYQPLSSAQPAQGAGQVTYLLQVIVDCVSGMNEEREKKHFSVRAQVSGATRPHSICDVSTPVRVAGRGVVANSRFLSAQVANDVLWGEVKKRIRLLYSKGGKWTPEEVSYVLPGLVAPDVAARLMKDIEKEGTGHVDADGAIEILFEQQLRLEVDDPFTQGLHIELLQEPEGYTVGVLEWTNLGWVAGLSPMEDDMQAYHLQADAASPGGGTETDCKIYLKRVLMHRRPDPPAHERGGRR
mmetsp:Transcript_27984/g.80202  ORF Transcript_27984/g.80202 Transcript_27984/m.80202 type:complete len:612 (-) Transcript_27984:116-1951(-)